MLPTDPSDARPPSHATYEAVARDGNNNPSFLRESGPEPCAPGRLSEPVAHLRWYT